MKKNRNVIYSYWLLFQYLLSIGFIRKKYYKSKGLHINLIHPNKIPIEMHYLLFAYRDLGENELPIFEDKMCLEMNKIKVPTLSKEMQLVEVFLHNSLNHGFVVDYKRWQEDLKIIILNYDIDWDRFLYLVKKTKLPEVFYRSIKLVEKFNHEKLIIPKEVVEEIYKTSSLTKLFFTKFFDNKFYNEYKIIEERVKKLNSKLERLRQK